MKAWLVQLAQCDQNVEVAHIFYLFGANTIAIKLTVEKAELSM